MTEYEALGRIALAALLGAIVGFDREAHSGSAGLRTHMLVALGAATFAAVAVQVADHTSLEDRSANLDPTRILEGIITGIGFLGGAIVFREGGRARNVTTAAGIWCVTGVGMLVGLGHYILGSGLAIFIVIILYVLKIAEQRQTRLWNDDIADDVCEEK